jgi:hypothetical protein
MDEKQLYLMELDRLTDGGKDDVHHLLVHILLKIEVQGVN